ncbi:2-iminoacetate synthase ThiH [Gorillibacterium sp. sgz5001074]|uniref:2-iminoacetate synthase ThiH n=1 Tax=Gorillibacterium sp. sgz5001074 TaxID=3446695 RepID=UPI003F66EAFC
MSFYEVYQERKNMAFEDVWRSAGASDVENVLEKEELTEEDFLLLLSPAAETLLEKTAERAEAVTARHHGREITLFAPLYLSDHCTNHCVYCSFSHMNEFHRRKLDVEQIAEQGACIAATGVDHLLLLTGDSVKESPVSYIRDAALALRDRFSWIGIEINALKTEEYAQLAEAGVTGLTLYQEVYDESVYRQLHLKGPKRNYRFRLDAPERGCQAGMRSVGIGALLGLNDWRREVFFTGLHARYLQERYPGTAISLSPPRMRPFAGSFQPRSMVGDRELMQAVIAYRLFLPRCGLTLSTREPAWMRDRLVRMGITKMSAGVSTSVGGYAEEEEAGVPQFQISDERSVGEVCGMLRTRGFRPVLRA